MSLKIVWSIDAVHNVRMSHYRFYCPRLKAGRVVLDAHESRHAVDVLRLRGGESVDLFDGNGHVAEGLVVAAVRSGCLCDVRTVRSVRASNGSSLVLCTALPRTPRQQFLFEKCTELGVARLVPTIYERSVVKPKSASIAKWRRWTVEAGKQCGSVRLPIVDDPVFFHDSLAMRGASAVALVGVTSGARRAIGPALDDVRAGQPVVVWIGPEGGFTDEESGTLTSAGAEPVSLGDQVLRIETACLAVAALAMSRGVASS